MVMEMRVDKITVPAEYTRTPPKESKIENHAVYYKSIGNSKNRSLSHRMDG